ncbi:MAG: alpha-L-fucosidase [Saprospiraceae bacterium]
MNKILIILAISLIFFNSCKQNGSSKLFSPSVGLSESPSVKKWRDNKLAMMIHFGLYSQYGGVYKGQQITKGYSEQIMAQAPIPAEEYKASAADFNPTLWNADSVAQLAVKGGFKSVVITAKHHDGFCMFDSQFSDFTIVKSTPFKRDVIKELTDAASRAGIGFGVYFSLIDWNAKEGATVISEHNADPISPALHQANLNQIRELCNNYGSLSELWFDMGSLTMSQSKEIRKLVKDLQPNCMIGGRLGNGQGDFSVLGDNQMPEGLKFECPWQTVNSIFSDTWGYRSWQKNGNANEIAQLHLAKIVETTYKGGNYTLNIGPKGDGSIVDLEKQVIENIGQWMLSGNGEAIYNTRPYPGGSDKTWGGVTYNPPNIYFITTSTPDEGKIVLYGLKNEVTGAMQMTAPFDPIAFLPGTTTHIFDLGLTELKFRPATTFRMQYTGDLDLLPSRQTSANAQNKYELSQLNANINYATDGANYYSTVPSITKLTWDITTPKEVEYEVMLYYTQQEKNKIVKLNVNGHYETLDLSKYKTFRQEPNDNTAIPSAINYQGPYTGLDLMTNIGEINWAVPSEPWGPDKKGWTEIQSEQGKIVNLDPQPMQSYYYLINLLAYKHLDHILAVGTADAFVAYLNGRLIYSAGYPQTENNVVFLDLPLEGESNTLIFKNLHINGPYKTFYTVMIDQIRFEKLAEYSKLVPKETNHIELTLANPDHPNENMGTPNIKIVIQEKKK